MLIERLKKIKWSDFAFAICVAISFCLMCIMLYSCFNNTIWRDEVASLEIIRDSYIDIIVRTAKDVHPPLYYIILKVLYDPLVDILPFINHIYIAKLISMLAVIILFYFAVFKFSKVIPKMAVGMFLILFYAFDSLEDMTLSIRMYSFAVLFVGLTFYYMIKIIRENNLRDWWLYVLFFECAAYTHNFALVAVGGSLLYLFIYTIASNRKNLKRVFLFAIACLAFFCPWLIVLIKQFMTIHSNYWIEQLNYNSIMGLINYTLSFHFENFQNTIAIISIIAMLIMLMLILISKNIELKEKWICASGFFVTAFLFLFGIVVSFIFDPILNSRYTTVIFVPYYMSFAYTFVLFSKHYLFELLQKFKPNFAEKNFKKFVASVVIGFWSIVISIITVNASIKVNYEQKTLQDWQHSYEKTQQFLAKHPNATLIFNSGIDQACYACLFQKYNSLTFEEGVFTDLLQDIDIYRKTEKISLNQISYLLDDGEEILFVCEDVDMQRFDEVGIEYQLLGDDFRFEKQFDAKVYLLSKV